MPTINLDATDPSGVQLADGSTLQFVAKETFETVLKGTSVEHITVSGTDSILLLEGTYTVYYTDVGTSIKQGIGTIIVLPGSTSLVEMLAA